MDREISSAVWRKSSYSGDNGGACVEVAANLPGVVAVRDSKNPAGPVLAVPPSDWQAFTHAIGTGMFDLT
jgi:hypothetical protein